MLKTISNSFMPIVKWVSVVAVSATAVISIQAIADVRHADSAHAQSEVNAIPASVVTPRASSQVPWTPANGFADLIEDVSPAGFM